MVSLLLTLTGVHLKVKSKGKNHKCVTEISLGYFTDILDSRFEPCGQHNLHKMHTAEQNAKMYQFHRFFPSEYLAILYGLQFHSIDFNI